jgi:hypothetical protein
MPSNWASLKARQRAVHAPPLKNPEIGKRNLKKILISNLVLKVLY